MDKGETGYQKRTQRDYSFAFKLKVVDEVEKGEKTYKEAQKEYGIQGRSIVLVWLRKHGRLDWKKEIKGIQINRRDQVWVSDITYIRTDEGFSYAAMITDAYTRKIVGCSIDRTMTVQLALDALKMAIRERQDYTDLIHHSDRGIQYCCREYTEALASNKIRISMTGNSGPYENALAERINRTIKEEFIINEKVRSFPLLKNLFYESVEIYNKERPHLALAMRKPGEVYSQI